MAEHFPSGYEGQDHVQVDVVLQERVATAKNGTEMAADGGQVGLVFPSSGLRTRGNAELGFTTENMHLTVCKLVSW